MTKELWDAFIEIVKQYALKSIAGLSTLQAWLAKIVLNAVIKWLKKVGYLIKEKKEAKDELKEYEDKLNDPNLTEEERRDADRDFLK